jgi:TolB-like protein/Tfp pilus assembly protein PilF
MRLFIAEAKRRHVFRAAGLYAGAAFMVLQLADILMPTLGIPDSAITYLLLVIAAGFPLVLVGAWVLDISGDGLSVTKQISEEEQHSLKPGKFVDYLIVVIALGVGFLYVERFTQPNSVITKTDTSEKTAPIETLLEPSIAVLPFENLSESKQNEYFAAGIHEDILNNLSQISGLIVTSRTSTLAFAGSNKPIPSVAAELGVNYIIEGSVRRSANRVRISVQLIEAKQDKHIWSEGYERDIVDVFEIQQDVANQVSHALKVQFHLGGTAGERPTQNLEAYEMFIEARELGSTYEPDNVVRAISLYRKILNIDPDYSDAWAGLALALQSTDVFGKADKQIEEATIASDKALALAPDSWMANYSMAERLASQREANYAEASKFYERAIEINPNDGRMLAQHGFSLWFEGKAGQAKVQFLAAYRRDPLSALANMARAMAAAFDREKVSSVKFIERAIEIDPEGTFTNWWAGNIFSLMGDFEKSNRQYAKVLERAPTHLGAMLWVATNMTTLDDFDTANYWLNEVEKIAPNNSIYMWRRANTYSGMDMPDDYLAHVERWLKLDPENMQALRYKGYARARLVRRALEQEDSKTYLEMNKIGLEETMAFLNLDGDEAGNPVVRFDSSWSFLYAANYARILGEDEMANQYYQMVINYYANQPPGAMPWMHQQLVIAKAGLGLVDEAVDHARALEQTNYRASWLFRAYNVDNDIYGIYNGIDKNIAFRDVVARMDAKNKQTIANIRAQSPSLFPRSASDL